MTHKTRGIVLRSIKYGETSLVVTVFTELFGIQTYMVNGVRSSKSARSVFFQPAAILDWFPRCDIADQTYHCRWGMVTISGCSIGATNQLTVACSPASATPNEEQKHGPPAAA